MTTPPAIVPQVSVILPVYNGGRYLTRAIESVLSQTFADFELLVCDDASSDSSADIVARISDPRVRLMRHETNQGLFPTLNELIRESRADLVRLWAQDDMMRPHCLETEVWFHREHPDIAMSYCACDMIDEADAVVRPAPLDRTPALLRPEQSSEIMFYYGSITGNISNVMLRRATFERIGLFRGDLKVSGDFEMWVRIAEQSTIGFVHEALIQLRRHRGQFSRRRGIMPQFMRENREIHAALLNRLAPATQEQARRYLRRHIHVQYAHHAVRCLLDGDLNTAVETYAVLREQDRPLPVFFWWLVSANGRWLRLRPRLVTV